jgi:hypothetical protein
MDEILRDAVAFEVEKANRLADFTQLGGDRPASTWLPAQIGGHIKRGDFLVRIWMIHPIDGFVIVLDLTPDVVHFHGVHRCIPQLGPAKLEGSTKLWWAPISNYCGTQEKIGKWVSNQNAMPGTYRRGRQYRAESGAL